jgi:uracil-DNA glycosylase
MSEKIVDEILTVSAAIKEQLRFYRELGIEDIGGSARATVMDSPADSEKPANILTEREDPVAADVPDSEVQAHSVTEAEQSALFGDVPSSGQQGGSRKRHVALPVIESADASIEAIREDIGDCTRCRLHEQRKTIVFGEGDPNARLVFVGEGPGADEDASGRPFVGRAGQLLDKIILAIGLKREEVYIANIVKCRPPGNRTPERDEVETCEPFLLRQLAFIRPDVIVALGSPAFQCLLRTRESITRARGEWRDWNGIKVMPTFHPAFLLRSPDKKREVWEDMKKVRDYLNAKSS